jgi:2-dehydropantoate 2-reductase
MGTQQIDNQKAIPNAEGLRVLVFGAGAIGTYIGGSLALQGSNVTFIERPQVAAGIQSRGMRLHLPNGEHSLSQPDLCGSLDEALQRGPYQVAIFALKSTDTQAALNSIAPFAKEMPPVLCLQNGVENETALADVLGAEKVIPGTVTSAIGRREAGDITLEKLRGMGLWSGHPLASRLARALNEAGLNAHLYPDAIEMKWSKMLTNLLANATSAILGMTPAEIFADPRLYRLEIRQLRETLAVMDAQGIQTVNLPHTPVRWLAWAIRWLPLSISRPFLQRAVGSGRGRKMPSFYIDLHSGRGSSEVEYLNGAVVRFGKKWGVPTPVNRVLTDTLMELTRGKIPVDAFDHQPKELLSLFYDPVK